MADLFTRTEVNFGGAMHAQYGLIAATNNGLTGLLMQNLTIQYAQAVTRLYELGVIGQKTHVYYISGRAQGALSVAHVVGPGPSMISFYNNYGDVCQAGMNTIHIGLAPNLCGDQTSVGAKYIAKQCVLTSIGLAVAAADFVINTQAQIMFSGLEPE